MPLTHSEIHSPVRLYNTLHQMLLAWSNQGR